MVDEEFTPLLEWFFFSSLLLITGMASMMRMYMKRLVTLYGTNFFSRDTLRSLIF